MLKIFNKLNSDVNMHPVRSNAALIFKAAANSILLSNNEARLTPKEVFFGEARNNFRALWKFKIKENS